MQKSVLAEIIRSLGKKEVRDLNKWLQSPSHNQRQDVVKLFDYLVKVSGKADSIYEKELAWKAIFASQPYDDAFMRQVMYFLLKAIEEYLVFTDFTSDRVQYQLSLTRSYRKRKLDKSYKQAHRLGIENLENQPLRNDWYLLNKFFLAQEDYEHKMSISQNAPVNLQETADALEKWFLEERLRVSNAMLAHHRVYQKITYDHGFLEKAISYMEDRKMLNDPSLAVYYYAYQAFTHPSEDHYFNNLEHLIHHEMDKFEHSEVRALYLAALNYCVPKINQGRHDFYQKAFDLYKKGLDTGILIENGVLSRYTFLNAVSSALKTHEYDWAEQFIEQFQPFLDEKQRQGSVNFSLSRLYFERGDYDKAQQFLMQFEYDDMLQNIVAKTMLLKIYFERDDFDAFESLLESMRTYLQRKEALDPARKLAYKNMISMMKKFLHHNIFSKIEREKFRETIVKTHPLAEREWLLEQIDQR
jgi:hypothetical protein